MCEVQIGVDLNFLDVPGQVFPSQLLFEALEKVEGRVAVVENQSDPNEPAVLMSQFEGVPPGGVHALFHRSLKVFWDNRCGKVRFVEIFEFYGQEVVVGADPEVA
jgi:hypothetical protein